MLQAVEKKKNWQFQASFANFHSRLQSVIRFSAIQPSSSTNATNFEGSKSSRYDDERDLH